MFFTTLYRNSFLIILIPKKCNNYSFEFPLMRFHKHCHNVTPFDFYTATEFITLKLL